MTEHFHRRVERVRVAASGRRPVRALGMISVLSLLLAPLGGGAAAQTICVVPGSFATIAAALGDLSCNIIELPNAAYREAVVIDRDVELRGRGATRTTLYGTAHDGTAFATSVVHVNPGATVLLSDLGIRDGRAPNGGGITNDGGQLTLLRCLVENNEATDIIGEGGGILNRAGGGLVLIETTVRKNRARLNGGGISSSGLSVPILSDPETRQNLADAYAKLRSVRIPNYSPFPTPESLVAIGEAFFAVGREVIGAVGDLLGKGLGNLIEGAAPADRTRTSLLETGFTALAIADSVIEDNTVETGGSSAWGGGLHADQGFVLIENSRISGNRALGRIGSFGGGVSAGLSFTLIRNTEIVHNEARSQTVVSGGGAIWNLGGVLDVHDSRLDDNSATSFFHNNGGAIQNMGGVTRVLRSTLDRNKSGNGGGIANHYMGELTVEDCSIRDNQVDGVISAFGGGIKNEKGSTATIRRTAITGNSIRGRSRGGGIYNESEAEVYEKQIAGHKVVLPLWNTSRVTIENSTISGNVIDGRKQVPKPFKTSDCQEELDWNLRTFPSLWQQAYARYEDCQENGFGETLTLHLPARGAGIYTGSQELGLAYTTVRNSTITGNEALGNDAHGGGIYSSMASGIFVLRGGWTTDIALESSLVVHNTPKDCDRFSWAANPTFNATRANLDSDGTCRAYDGNFATSDPQLFPLGRYGGPTLTHAIAATSPAKDATTGCPATDQRGESRSLGGICDIGAFELTPPRGVADAYAGQEDEPIIVAGERNVLANDMGIQLGNAVVDTPAQHGSVVLQANGDFIYTPERDYFGEDGFTYRATDASGTTIGPIPVTLSVAGRLDVISVNPEPESTTVARRPAITVAFDDPMALAGVAGRVFLYGDRSKLSPRIAVPASQLAVDGHQLTITPTHDFAPGERITLVLSDLVTSALGIRLPRPLVTEFVVGTDGGGGGFSVFEIGSLIGHRVVLGDLDGDGDLDAVIASEFTGVATQVWRNTGSGFAPGQMLTYEHRTRGTQPFRASGLALADLDGDGDLDLIATTRDIDQFTVLGRDGVHTRVWFNNGDGTFTASEQDFLSGTYPDPSSPILQLGAGVTQAMFTNTAAHRAVALGDLDGDGDIDAFIVAGQGRRGRFGTGDGSGARQDSVWLNDGDGNFTRGATVGFDYGDAVALGDLDGDGDLDAVVANESGSSRVWFNDGHGNFSSGPTFPRATDVRIADFNGDGHLDVLFVPGGVWLGDGAGGFTRAPIQPDGTTVTAVAVGDIDGDGDIDIIAVRGVRYEYFQVHGVRDEVWLNDGDGNFTASRQRFSESYSAAVALGDIDRDGLLDAFVLKIGAEIETVDGVDWRRAAPAPVEVWFGLPLPVTAPDTYTIAEDTVLSRSAANGVFANDDAPGAQARHPWRVDRYRAASGTLGGLWLDLFDVHGLTSAEMSVLDFERDSEGWYTDRRVTLGQPSHGTVVLAPDGSFTYTPDPDFFGIDSFSYYAETPAADSAPPETVTIHVTPVNDPPVAVDDFYPFSAGGVVVAAAQGVLQNDFDVDGDPLTAVLAIPPLRGTVDLKPDGGFAYTPGANSTGGDVFFYRAVDPSGAPSAPARVKLGNSVPAGQDQLYTPDSGGSLTVDPSRGLYSGANDPDGDELTIVVTVEPRFGTVAVQSDGSFVYTPGPDWPGSDVFVYVLSDGTDTSSPIRVKIGNRAPAAHAARYVTGENTTLTVAAPGLLANDLDPDDDPLTASLMAPPSSGDLQLQSDGSFVYTPAPGFVGAVTFTYAASDGIASAQATVTVAVANDLQILSRAPQANAIGVPAGSDVSITFDLNLRPASLDGRVRITGAQRGVYAAGLSAAAATVAAQPFDSFFPGERITVTAIEGIEGGANGRLMRSQIWRFDVATAVASGQMLDSGQALGSTHATAIALGDFDGDGDLDAFVVSGMVGSSVVYLNDGNGNFSVDPAQDLSGRRASDVAFGDIDGDGDLDIFIAGISHGTFPVFNVDGVFDWPAFTPVGRSLVPNGRRVALADLDGDGDLDAVIATSDAASIVVALNDGFGEFTVVSQIEAGDVRSLALGDLDGDGIIDLVVGTDDGVRVWLGNGLGAFTTPRTVTTHGTLGLLVNSVDIGDLDGDGHPDVFAGGLYRRVYFNDGSGNLVEGPDLYVGSASHVSLGDLDGDGDLDVFITTLHRFDDGLRPYEILLNDGNGNFEPGLRAATHSDYSGSAALGDLDGDGDLDAFVGTHASAFVAAPDRVLFNQETSSTAPTGRFVDSEQRLGDEASREVLIADFDGDGHLDAYIVNHYGSFADLAHDELWINDGTGGFTPSPFDTPAVASIDGVVGDLDGDGYPDLILLGLPTNVYINNGAGRLDLLGPALEDTLTGKVYLADLDGDGALDAIQLRRHADDRFKIWMNDGAGTFSLSETLIRPAIVSGEAPFSSTVHEVAIFDADGDGHLDIYATTTTAEHTLWRNDGTGHFPLSLTQSYPGEFRSRVAAADIDGDGDIDLLLAGLVASARIRLNDGTGAFSNGQLFTARTGGSFSTFADVNADGHPDAVFGRAADPAEFWINDGNGNFTHEEGVIGSGPSLAIAFGDLDGDGDLDAVVGLGLSGFSSVRGPNEVWFNSTLNPALEIRGAGPLAIGDDVPVAPFADVVVTAPAGGLVTLRIEADTTAPGSFTAASLAAAGFSMDEPNVWRLLGATPGVATAALRSLVFEPVANRGPVGLHEVVQINLRASTPAESIATDDTVITITSINDPPVAGPPPTLSVPEGGTVELAAPGLLAGAFDPDVGDVLSVVLLTAPAAGDLGVLPGGAMIFVAGDAGPGPVSFTYQISDGRSASMPVTATITITEINRPPFGSPDEYFIEEDSELVVAAPGVLGNDGDPNGDPIQAVFVSAVNGDVVLNADGSFVYTPPANYFGTDTFLYTVFDGQLSSSAVTVTIHVEPVNDVPVAVPDAYATTVDTPLEVLAPGVLANDLDADDDPLHAMLVQGPERGSLTLGQDGSIHYIPEKGFHGLVSFTYAASDGTATSPPATVEITVGRAEGQVRGEIDIYFVNRNEVLEVPPAGVLENDHNPDSGVLEAWVSSEPSHGMLSLESDGSFTYTPDVDFHGADLFFYVARSSSRSSDPIAVIVVVDVNNEAPVAMEDAYEALENTALVVPAPGVLGNDTDAESDPLTAELVSGPAHGSVELDPDGGFTYTPDAGYVGPDSFTYLARDRFQASEPVTVSLTILPFTCGDWIVQGEEQCDDGNLESGDGCTDRCVLEPENTVAGRGVPSRNCAHHWLVTPPPARGTRVRCTDGDPACDAGPAGDGVCHFRVALCFQVDDGSGACRPTAVQELRIRAPKLTSRDQTDIANRRSMEEALGAIGARLDGTCLRGPRRALACDEPSDCDSRPGAGDGMCQRTAEFVPAMARGNQCTASTLIEVPVWERGVAGSRAQRTLRVQTRTVDPLTNVAGRPDADTLTLRCDP